MNVKKKIRASLDDFFKLNALAPIVANTKRSEVKRIAGNSSNLNWLFINQDIFGKKGYFTMDDLLQN
jgi:hypothetical protein